VGETLFWGKRKCKLQREIRTASNKQNWRKRGKIRKIVRENRRLTVRNIAEEVNIDRETDRRILTEDPDMRKVCVKMVPKELTKEQMQSKVKIFQYLL
jgi:hypothetical protein